MNLKRVVASLTGLLIVLASLSYQLFARELDYDKYAPALTEPRQASRIEKSLTQFPVLPFALVKYPTEKTLNYLERNKITAKMTWIYDWIQDKGVTPKASIMGLASLNTGAEVDFVRLLRQKEHHADLIAESWIQYNRNTNFRLGSRLGKERIAGTGFRTEAYFQYENRPNEYFFGIGPNSSKGEGYGYEREDTHLEYLVGYKPGMVYSTNARLRFTNTNIYGGTDGSRGRHGEGLLGPQVPGIEGDKILTYQLDTERDTRNQGSLSTQGSLARLLWSYNDGVDGSDAGFYRYAFEGAKYLTLGSKRRVLAGHILAEHQNESSGHYVPFHQMARLGGFGPFNYLTQPLRGYENNRFTDNSLLLFNLEYRYNIWEYRDWKTDAVIFTDIGQVFDRIGDARFDHFKVSYGTGLRTSVANFVALSLEIAHGDEGTAYYAKSSTPF